MWLANKKLCFALVAVLFAFVSCREETRDRANSVIELNKNWEFSKAGSGDWMSAIVPGCIHTDLLSHEIIPDPFYADNEKQVQWIGGEDWEYRTFFSVDSALYNQKYLKLKFAGLDTYADVYLNDFLLGSTNNMFCSWEFDIRKNLIPGRNILRIYFHSPVLLNNKKAKKLRYKLPDNRVFTRKAPYQFGWDWGPKLITCGIWKNVTIESTNNYKINDVRICTINIDENKAELYAEVEIIATGQEQLTIEIIDDKKAKCLSTYTTEVSKGVNRFAWNFSIKNPKLWWPNGMGEPFLYSFLLKASTQKVFADTLIRIGLRDIKLVQNKDTVGVGFFFRVNGKDVFMKGANYIPQDNFPARVSNQQYSQLIENAKAANMNMLRVWGGGFYENDIFYDLCDENGILVWQDFMFSCAMYPGDLDFINNVSNEATQVIKRLRNHACLALWCGNNEVDNGWKDWGWQKQYKYSKAESSTIYSHYKKVFNDVLPTLVAELDGKTPYWPSSPEYGWGHGESNTHGDSHYWGVWWGKEDFKIYEDKVGRFMSEYGFQAYPDFETVNTFCAAGDLYMFSDALKNHQKHPVGNETILEYMEREYPVSDSLFVFTYLSQLVQAGGIQTAIEAHRRAKPYCMGTLYWQLNDCWPVVSWSSIDYYGRWKALHYKVRDLYKNFMISVDQQDSMLFCYVVSDSTKSIKVDLEVELIDFYGNKLFSEEYEMEINSNTSNMVATFNLKELLPDSMLQRSYISFLLSKGRKKLANRLHYFDVPKNLQLPKPKIIMEVDKVKQGYEISLAAEQLVKNLYLHTAKAKGHFSDNYFDLLPDKEKMILFKTEDLIDFPLKEFQYQHLQEVGE